MSRVDRITGTWQADGNTGNLVISYGGRRVQGFYSYQSIGRSKARAVLVEDTNNSGRYEGTDLVFGGFSARSSFVTSGRIPVVASGRFVADPETGRFKLFYGSTAYATGSIFDPAEYF